MANLYPRARLLWSLTSSGLGTTLSADGDSGGWAGLGPGMSPPATDAETPVDLRDICDVTLMVSVGDITDSPTLAVTLNVFDDLGSLYATGLASGDITEAGTAMVSGGLHGGYDGTSSAYLVLPMWAQVAWTCSGGTVTGTEISLLGR